MTLEELNEDFLESVNKQLALVEATRKEINTLKASVKEATTSIDAHKNQGQYRDLSVKRSQELKNLKQQLKEDQEKFIALRWTSLRTPEDLEKEYDEKQKALEKNDKKLAQLRADQLTHEKNLSTSVSQQIDQLSNLYKVILTFEEDRLNTLAESGDYEEDDLKDLHEEIKGRLTSVERQLKEIKKTEIESLYQVAVALMKDTVALSKQEKELLGEKTTSAALRIIGESEALQSPMKLKHNISILADYFRETRETETQEKEAIKEELVETKKDLARSEDLNKSTNETLQKVQGTLAVLNDQILGFKKELKAKDERIHYLEGIQNKGLITGGAVVPQYQRLISSSSDDGAPQANSPGFK